MTRRRLLAALATVEAAWCAADEERIWSDYVDWYRTQPITVTDPRVTYLEHLKRAGLSEAEIRERGSLLERLIRERRQQLHPFFFDRTYTSPQPRFNTAPNALLVEAVKGRKPGRALDVDMGQGRNALFLASQGWSVTGFDFSEDGVRTARQAAQKAGLTLAALVRRHEDFDFGKAQWDLVVMSYTWVPLAEPYVSRIVDSLRPGGLLVYEHLMDESGSENSAPWLPKPGGLPKVFGRLRVVRYRDARTQADWSWRPERVARLIAEKPAAR